jgi:hypothetical protein
MQKAPEVGAFVFGGGLCGIEGDVAGSLETGGFPKWIKRFDRQYCWLEREVNLFDDRASGGVRYLLWGEPGCQPRLF